MAYHPTTEGHLIKLTAHERDGKWEIRVSGITSGAEIHFGDGDNGSVTFFLDAGRFHPELDVNS